MAIGPSAASSSMIAQSSRRGSSMARHEPTSSPSASATRCSEAGRSGSQDGIRAAMLMRGSVADGAGTPSERR